MVACPRTRLGPLLLAALLVVAAAVSAGASGIDRAASDRSGATEPGAVQTSAPRHEVRTTFEANEPTATVAPTTRADDGLRTPTGRALAVFFAAAIALAALTAICRASSTPTIARRRLAFDVRRRGPPLLIGS